MKVALWTPDPRTEAVSRLEDELGRVLDLRVVRSEPAERPAADVDLYHVAASPAHGFVYRALVRRPGVVLLAEWGLHALVHAETAGRGDPAAYLREARYAHGDTGVFVARQVLAGLGGALPGRLAINQRVLERSLALAAFTEGVRERAAARLPGRRVVLLPAAGEERARGVAELVAAIDDAAPRVAAEQARFEREAEAAETPRMRAAVELRWAARELGLVEPPADAAALVEAMLQEGR